MLFLARSCLGLTAVSEAFRALLAPLVCEAQYVPLLPAALVRPVRRPNPTHTRARRAVASSHPVG